MTRFFQRLFGHQRGARHLRTGLWGEKVAAKMLKKKGWRILGKRVRVGKRDELDIVARSGDTLVFVEVKTRRNESYGRPAAAIKRDKRRRLCRAAIRYRSRLRKPPEYLRFDIVEVVGGEDEGDPVIRHIENAFSLDRRYRL